MQEVLEFFFHKIPRESYQLGDIILMRRGGQPRHLGVIVNAQTYVHACIVEGKVIPSVLRSLPLGLMRSAFRYPGVQEAMQ